MTTLNASATHVPPIRAIRQAQGLSQNQLAKRSGIPQGQLSMVERGKAGLSLEAFYRVTEEIGPRELSRLLKPYVVDEQEKASA